MCELGLQATPQSLGLSVQSRFTPAPSWQQDQLCLAPSWLCAPCEEGTVCGASSSSPQWCPWLFMKVTASMPIALHLF